MGGVLTILLYTHFQKMPLLPTLDTCAAALPIGHAIGRLGCFAAGCCYGKPTTVAWGVVFKNPMAEQLAGTPLGVHLHPTQLYEASLEFLNFLFLMWLGKRQRFIGEIFGAYLMLVRHRARHHRIFSRRSRAHHDVSRQRFADADHEPGVDSDWRVPVVARPAG